MAQDGKLKMRYLPLRARAEPIHMVLKHGNIDYEAITIPFAEWPACKASGEFTLFGQLPSMQLPSGKIICQTAAIVRYAAHVAGISPPDAEATADSDMIWELVSELNLINPILNWFEAGSQDFTTSKAAYFAALPGHLSAAERVLGDKQFFAGASPSYGDFGLLHILYNSTTVEPTCLDGHPVIGAWFARMKGLPSMQKYLAERPKEVGRPGSLITTLQL